MRCITLLFDCAARQDCKLLALGQSVVCLVREQSFERVADGGVPMAKTVPALKVGFTSTVFRVPDRNTSFPTLGIRTSEMTGGGCLAYER